MTQIVPPTLRSSVFALDRCIAGVVGAAMAPLVGILAERCFGFDTKQYHHHGAAVSHAQSAQVVAQNLNNARALERGLLLVLVVPVCIKFVVRLVL